jgi:hypothetical protein
VLGLAKRVNKHLGLVKILCELTGTSFLLFFSLSLPLSRPSSMFSSALLVLVLLARVGVLAQTYSVTYLPSNAPAQSEQGQTGTNQCGTTANQTSICQNAYSEYSSRLKLRKENPFRYLIFLLVNSIDDFCIYAPPDPGPGSVIGNTEVRRVGSRHVYENEYD